MAKQSYGAMSPLSQASTSCPGAGASQISIEMDEAGSSTDDLSDSGLCESDMGHTGTLCKIGTDSDLCESDMNGEDLCEDLADMVKPDSEVLRETATKTSTAGIKRKPSVANFINPQWTSLYIYNNLISKDRQVAEVPAQENLTQPLVPDKYKRSGLTQYLTLDTGNRNLGFRLEQRKKLILRRRRLVDVEFVMAMTGILLMMVENELYYANRELEKENSVSFVLKLAITLTTIILLVAILLYYQAGIALKMFDGRVDDPFAVTPISTWIMLAVELSVCAIHPFPGNIQVSFLILKGGMETGSIDGILSVLMMLRLYLVGKFIVVHSQLLTDSRAHTLAAVSQVKVNIYFVFKAALARHPAEVIATIILCEYAVSVWSMRTCELYYTDIDEDVSLTEAMWLSAITFLTVGPVKGYGDVTPRTHCGRFIAVSTAMMGLCSTALLVAVIGKKLEQTHRERYVYNFLIRVHLRNKFKAAAADVVKHAVKLFPMRRKAGTPASTFDRTVLNWRLNSAIRTMRSTRAAQAELEETSVGLTEVCQIINTVDKRLQETREMQKEMLERMELVQRQLTQALVGRHAQDSTLS